ncbi:hypothetical protein QBC39DRAFT_365443 [Podospora conica]|nr:hypothetical protein QBC39DRAFT_365443 [Schizothecium conicum]
MRAAKSGCSTSANWGMMKSWYVAHPGPRVSRSKPFRYCASDKGSRRDDLAAAFCLRADLSSSRVAMACESMFERGWNWKL